MRQWEPGPPPHRCPTPRPTGAHDGDLWRCASCRQLWAVEAYQLSGVSPMTPMELRWVRPRLRDRIWHHDLRPRGTWGWLGTLAAVFLIAWSVANLGERFGWWNLS